MIILRKPASSAGTTSSAFISGNLIGSIDGVNKTFTTEYEYVPNRISISYNGQLLHPPYDFEQSGGNEITFIYISPEEDDTLKVFYQREITSFYGQVSVNLVYNSNIWETLSNSYLSIPVDLQVYWNGVRQQEDYYTASLSSGKLIITFDFDTDESDWTSIVYTDLSNI